MKNKIIIKIIAAICCFTLALAVVVPPADVQAKTLSEYKQEQAAAKKELDRLKAEKADKLKIKNALDKQISATQSLIDQCLDQLSMLNSQISEIEAQINKLNNDMADDKALFKKRVRAIYMSGSNSNIQILLGAESFSEYLVLAQMTKSVSAKDSKIIGKVVDAIEQIEAEKTEIQKLVDEQDSIKAELDQQKNNLRTQVAEVNGILKDINSDISQAQKDYDKASDEIDKMEAPPNSNITFNDTKFLWPVPNYYRISAVYNGNDSVHKGNHKGIDISTGGVAAQIVAAADGRVYIVKNSCTHNYGKNYSCGCGGGYGNYVAIDHGKDSSGTSYKTLYAHMTTALVKNGQYVKRGQVIGKVGTTGWSTGYHLHFETIVNGSKVNPQKFQYQR